MSRSVLIQKALVIENSWRESCKNDSEKYGNKKYDQRDFCLLCHFLQTKTPFPKPIEDVLFIHYFTPLDLIQAYSKIGSQLRDALLTLGICFTLVH